VDKVKLGRVALLIVAGWMGPGGAMGIGQTTSAPVVAPSANAPYVPTMTFDVASIRESPPADSYFVSGRFAPHSSSLRVTNFTVMNLVILAYGVQPYQIAGLPDWQTMWNIQAKGNSAEDDRLAKLSPEEEQLEQQHMAQVLLAERFNLKVHWESREGATYALVVGKNGPKLRAASGAPPSAEELKQWGDKPIPPLYQSGSSMTGFQFVGHGSTIGELAADLAQQFDRPVADKTGLTGKYDFTLRYHAIRASDISMDDKDPLPPLDEAIQDQLGLKIVPAKGLIPVLVIDHIEKPSAN
jgi:uncharacterized protein (TIGR03435 family)